MEITLKNVNGKLKNSINKSLSARGFYWSERKAEEKKFSKLVDELNVDKFFAKILSLRDINIENYNDFLEPKLKNCFPNPSTLDGLDKATELIVELIVKEKKIGIFGDYDVDGATSTAILGRFFKEINVLFEYYIPDRIKEGYGPNIEAFRRLSEKKCELIITVDCGTTSNFVIKKANDEKMTIIVVDHHQQVSDLPNAYSIINPNKNVDNSNLIDLAAVGVTYLLIVSINRKLKKLNFYKNKKEPNLFNYLDFVALGTICDVVKLDLFNRALVKQGIKVLNKTNNLGLQHLIKSSNISDELNEFHLGYVLGPKINAGGRVGKSSKGVELLLSENSSHCMIIADELNKFNEERKKIEKQVEESAIKKILKNKKIICVSGKDWHPGVIGIVAGRLTEKFYKPSIVISEGREVCKGSARSVSGFNIGNLIKLALENGILIDGGGHKMAAGLTIDKKKIPQLIDFVDKNFHEENVSIEKYYDAKIFLSNIDLQMFELINKISPFGSGNSKPKFCFENCFIKFPKLVGNSHVSCLLSDVHGNTVKSIAFKAFENKVGTNLLENKGNKFNVIGQINLNSWNGRESLQILIEDIISTI